MKESFNSKKFFSFFGLTAVIAVGSYNAIMINAESRLNQNSHFKRLDEVYGVVVEGRSIASKWTKLGESKKVITPKVAKKMASSVDHKSVASDVIEAEPLPEAPESIIQEALEMKLVDVINPVKWAKGVKPSEFNGAIVANHGVIESLYASLPGGLSLDIAFSELTGNIFNYDIEGNTYSAMMYQVDQSAYMVTLTDGPMEGTRLRFATEVSPEDRQEQMQQYLAETHQVEIGSFGDESAQISPEPVAQTTAPVAPAPAFNFDQQSI